MKVKVGIVSESDLSTYDNQSEFCMRVLTNKRVERRKCVRCRVMSIVSGTRVWSDFQTRVNTRVITSIVKVWGTCIRRLSAQQPAGQIPSVENNYCFPAVTDSVSTKMQLTDSLGLLWIRFQDAETNDVSVEPFVKIFSFIFCDKLWLAILS